MIPRLSGAENRSLVRMRITLQTRCKNQIKGFLSYYGITIPDELSNSHWSNRFICWLESLKESRREGLYLEYKGLYLEYKGLYLEYNSGKKALGVLLSELRYLRTDKRYSPFIRTESL